MTENYSKNSGWWLKGKGFQMFEEMIFFFTVILLGERLFSSGNMIEKLFWGSKNYMDILSKRKLVLNYNHIQSSSLHSRSWTNWRFFKYSNSGIIHMYRDKNFNKIILKLFFCEFVIHSLKTIYCMSNMCYEPCKELEI